MLFTTTAQDVGRRAFPLWPIFHITPGGAVVPWNRRARLIHPKTPERVARRRFLTRAALVTAAVVLVAVLTVMGATSGLLRTVGIAVLVVAGLAVLGLMGRALETVGWPGTRK